MPLPPPPEATAAGLRPEAAIVREINAVRGRYGLRTLRANVRLATVARRHSVTMLRLDVLTHGGSLRSRLTGGRRRYSETLAWAPSRGAGAGAVVSMWMHSASHRAVLLDGSLRRIGVGSVLGRMGSQPGFAITADFSS